MKHSLFIVMIMISTIHVWSQNTFLKTYGGSGSDKFSSVAKTNNGFIICGETNSSGGGNKDLLLVRTNQTGDTLWTKIFGLANDETGESVIQTSDSGFIALGYTKSAGSGSKDILVVKTLSDGNIDWVKEIGGSGDEVGYSIQQTYDGAYIVAGYTSSFGATAGNVYLVKLQQQGNIVWTKIIGGSGFDGAYAVRQTADSGMIVAGVTASFGAGDNDAFLMKLDSSGNLIWNKTYGGSDDDWAYSVKETNDGGFIFSGHTHSFGFANDYDIYLVRTNSTGDTLWTKCYGNTGEDIGWMTEETNDGGFILSGNAEIPGADHHNIYLMKTDSNGHLLWTKTYGEHNPSAVVNSDVSVAFISSGDKFVLTGNTNSFGAGGYDGFILKTDSNGNGACYDSVLNLTENATLTQVTNFVTAITTGANIDSVMLNETSGILVNDICSVVSIPHILSDKLVLNIYPNPASDYISIEGINFPSRIRIISLSGKVVYDKMISAAYIDISSLQTGIYFVQVISDTSNHIIRLGIVK